MAQTLDLLAIGSHPDDVELACGGTLAKLAQSGRKVGILHLTRGEAGTRGTPEKRKVEAESAGQALGVESVEFLDCGDGQLRTGPREEDALIEILRRHQPTIVLGPPAQDRHPDHRRAHRLVEASCFYSGLVRRGHGEPHRPFAVFHYMQNDSFEPGFIIDVTSSWDQKLAALDCYASQLHQPGNGARRTAGADSAKTKVASREFRLAIEGRARHFGLLIGAEFGEPFRSRLPLAVSDPLDVVPGRLR